MATSIDEALLIDLARRTSRAIPKTAKYIQLALSETDTESYRVLENICYGKGIQWGGEAHKAGIIRAFKSPLYSDDAKEYCAAANLNNELILLPADRFLTEKIILGYVENVTVNIMSIAYFAALIRSSHLSERIVSAAVPWTDGIQNCAALAMIPDAMITSEVMTSWLSNAWWRTSQGGGKQEAARRVRQVHPEYEGFPDEWVLKVFCGG